MISIEYRRDKTTVNIKIKIMMHVPWSVTSDWQVASYNRQCAPRSPNLTRISNNLWCVCYKRNTLIRYKVKTVREDWWPWGKGAKRKMRVIVEKRACECPSSVWRPQWHEVTTPISYVIRKLFKNLILFIGYLGIQFGAVQSTSQVANSFIGTGRVAGAVVFVRSAIFGPSAHRNTHHTFSSPRLAADWLSNPARGAIRRQFRELTKNYGKVWRHLSESNGSKRARIMYPLWNHIREAMWI